MCFHQFYFSIVIITTFLLSLFFIFVQKIIKEQKIIKKSTSAKRKESHNYGESKHKEENDPNIKANQNQKGSSSSIINHIQFT
jgi:hypothetical protein